jgi:hypothetical protein
MGKKEKQILIFAVIVALALGIYFYTRKKPLSKTTSRSSVAGRRATTNVPSAGGGLLADIFSGFGLFNTVDKLFASPAGADAAGTTMAAPDPSADSFPVGISPEGYLSDLTNGAGTAADSTIADLSSVSQDTTDLTDLSALAPVSVDDLGSVADDLGADTSDIGDGFTGF